MVNKFPNKEKELFPSEQQLLNYLKYKRLKAGQKASLNFCELEKWCLDHLKIPENPDEMFVKRSFAVVPRSHKVKYYMYACIEINLLFLIGVILPLLYNKEIVRKYEKK